MFLSMPSLLSRYLGFPLVTYLLDFISFFVYLFPFRLLFSNHVKKWIKVRIEKSARETETERIKRENLL